jgi:hypothetical protein
VLVVVAVCGIGAGGLINEKSGTDAAEHQGSTSSHAAGTVTATVTVTETKYALPDSCRRVMEGWEKYLHAAAEITSANGAQLDIMSEAYQAILQKDWKKLNDLTDRQRKLEHDLSGETLKLLPNLEQITKDIKQCNSDAGSPST